MLQKAFIPRVPGKVEVVLSSQQPEGKERSCVLVQAVTRYNTHTAIPSGKNKHNERVCVSDASKCVCGRAFTSFPPSSVYIFFWELPLYIVFLSNRKEKKSEPKEIFIRPLERRDDLGCTEVCYIVPYGAMRCDVMSLFAYCSSKVSLCI